APTREPAFGLPALWIPRERRQQAELAGYTVVEPATVIITHITELLRQHAADMLDRAQVHEMLDRVRERHPKVVEEIVPQLVSVGLLQNVLQGLLREWVPIRDMLAILETLSDHAGEQGSVEALVEKVRMRLGRTITQRHLNERGELTVFTLDGELEQKMDERLAQSTGGAWALPLEIGEWQRFVTSLNQAVAARDIDQPVLLTTPRVRPGLAQALRTVMSRITVLSIAEVPPQTPIETLDRIGLRDAH
ncbi:MAG: FHIPEP family type III secretion protein, partial [Mariprofundaceae bacterium]